MKIYEIITETAKEKEVNEDSLDTTTKTKTRKAADEVEKLISEDDDDK
jgi:hypothetical protein